MVKDIEEAPMDFHRPGPNKRVCAFLIDSLAAQLAAIILSFLGLPKIESSIWYVYILLKDIFNGQSLGKSLVDLQVVDDNNKPASVGPTILRNVFLIIPIFPIVEYFVMKKDPLGQRIGDRVAQTRVNDLKPETSDSVYLGISIFIFFIIIAIGIWLGLDAIKQNSALTKFRFTP